MIVCSCRVISDKDYTPEELIKRLLEKDVQCGTCCKDIKKQNGSKT